MNQMKHVAIIMDGNGRWGIKNKKSRNLGHKQGLKTVEMVIEETMKNKIRFLTLYASVLPQKTVRRIWDLFFVYGDRILYQVN